MTGPGPPSDDPPLVAPREDSTTWSSGIALVQDGEALLAAVESGSWKDEVLTGVVAGLDVAVAVLDPIGTLVASGIGWLVEHVQPLSDLLDTLTGDPDAVAAQARTWRNVAASVRESAGRLRRAGAPGPDWSGAAAEEFARSADDHAGHLGGAAAATDVLAAATEGAGQLVTLVREVVRDLISQLVTTLVERVPQWTLEEVGTLGIATPHVVSAALAVIARVATKVLRLAEGLVRSLEKLGELLARAGTIFEGAAARFARRADAHPAPTSAQGATPAPAGSTPSPGAPPATPSPGAPSVPPSVPPPSRIRETLGPEPSAAPTSVTAGMPPVAPGTRSLGTISEARVTRGADGLIEHIDGRPVDDYVRDLGRTRAEEFRLGQENGRFSKNEIGKVTSVALDRRTGALVEGVNGRPGDVIDPRTLHPTLEDRYRGFDPSGYPAINRDGSVLVDDTGVPVRREFPHPDKPLGHAEVKAVNELAHGRGPGASEGDLSEMTVANHGTFAGRDLREAPCCANCTYMLGPAHSASGGFTGFPPVRDEEGRPQ